MSGRNSESRSHRDFFASNVMSRSLPCGLSLFSARKFGISFCQYLEALAPASRSWLFGTGRIFSRVSTYQAMIADRFDARAFCFSWVGRIVFWLSVRPLAVCIPGLRFRCCRAASRRFRSDRRCLAAEKRAWVSIQSILRCPIVIAPIIWNSHRVPRSHFRVRLDKLPRDASLPHSIRYLNITRRLITRSHIWCLETAVAGASACHCGHLHQTAKNDGRAESCTFDVLQSRCQVWDASAIFFSPPLDHLRPPMPPIGGSNPLSSPLLRLCDLCEHSAHDSPFVLAFSSADCEKLASCQKVDDCRFSQRKLRAARGLYYLLRSLASPRRSDWRIVWKVSPQRLRHRRCLWSRRNFISW